MCGLAHDEKSLLTKSKQLNNMTCTHSNKHSINVKKHRDGNTTVFLELYINVKLFLNLTCEDIYRHVTWPCNVMSSGQQIYNI